MRKSLLVLGLVAASIFAAANDAHAQRGRRGGGGGGITFGGNGWSVGIGNGNYGRGYGNYGWGNNYGNYGGYGRGYYSPYNYGGYYSSPYYYSGPGYSYAEPYVDTTVVRPSYYSDPNSATVTVLLPNPDAQVWFDDAPTAQRGMERTYMTGSLQHGGTYMIKARWSEGGRTIDQQRTVSVQPGQTVTVDFRGEKLGAPRP